MLILSARSEVEDKVQGLDAGANDYLAKPFHLAELEARIRSLTLRQFTQQDVLLSCGGLSFDTRSRTAAVNGQTLTLTRKETGMLLSQSVICSRISAITVAVCLADMSASPLRSYPA